MSATSAIDQFTEQVLETLRAMWRRRWTGIAVAWIVAIIGTFGLSLMKEHFEASARVYVDTKTVLRPLMVGLAVEPDLDQTVGLLARTLITRPNVEALMKKTKLEAPDANPTDHENLVGALLRNIKIASSGRDNVFNFSFRDTSPERARLVVQNLVALFLESDTGTKRRDSEAAREFIDEQIKNYEARLADLRRSLRQG